MSKLKTPQEKKEASLSLDRRNTYGENDKSSRKNIPRSKKLSHKALRRIGQQSLDEALKVADEDSITGIESKHRSRLIAAQRNAFRKRSDRALIDVLEKKRTGRYIPRFSTQGNKP